MDIDITVRPATPEDAAVLATLMAQMDDEPASSETIINAAQMRAVLAEMSLYPDFRSYLVLHQGRAVGSFSLMFFRSPSHQGSRQALLDAVVVAREQRGWGFGKMMIAHALQLATAAGCYKMSLSSNLKRKDAHRFYESLGFAQHGISFGIALACQ